MNERKPASRESPLSTRVERTVNSEASLGREVQSKIGEQLRAIYDDVVSQGVPDRFAELLQRLEKKEGGSSK
ncbi:MAG: hypothetical protein QOD74_2229 [Variibacter sp.]|jgi:hypothetical protein|nr:hypothetical protein [Variibacter sp.]